MEDRIVQRVKRKITRAKYGEVFFVSSFPKEDVEYVTKLLAQFEKEGLITRIAKGVYVKAKKTQFGVMYPSVYDLVEDFAKRNRAKVIPMGVFTEKTVERQIHGGCFRPVVDNSPYAIRKLFCNLASSKQSAPCG